MCITHHQIDLSNSTSHHGRNYTSNSSSVPVSTFCATYLKGHTLLALPVVLGDLAAVLVDLWRKCKSLQEMLWSLTRAFTRPETGNLHKANKLLSALILVPSGNHNAEPGSDTAVLRTCLKVVLARLSDRKPACTCTEVVLANMMAGMTSWCLQHSRIVVAWRSIGSASKTAKGDLRDMIDAVTQVRNGLPNVVEVEKILQV